MPDPRQNSHFAPFPQTRWSIVVEAGGETPEARDALAAICHDYWLPLYAYVRRSGFGREDAEDLTQDFLTKLLQKGVFAEADASKGKLRTFLLVALKRFLHDRRRYDRAQKRGGGVAPVPIDSEFAERELAADGGDGESPDKLFAKRWAQTVLESVFDELAAEYDTAGKGAHFDRLSPYLHWNAKEAKYADVAVQLNMTEGAVKVAVYRLRRRYRSVFRTRVLETLSDESELEEEIQFFFDVLG